MTSINDPIRVDSHGLRAYIDGREYLWNGGFGSVIISNERGVKQGECRMIGSVLFYARSVGRTMGHREVNWVPAFDIDIHWIRRFRAEMFGVHHDQN